MQNVSVRRITQLTPAVLIALGYGLPAAHATGHETLQATRQAPWSKCFAISGARYNINPYLLAGISVVESRGNPRAVSPSPAYGLLQIDHSWLPRLNGRFGFTKDDLFNPCANIEVGAWILAHELRARGDTWEAVGALNASCTRLKGQQCKSQRAWYSWKVYQAMGRLTPRDIGLASAEAHP